MNARASRHALARNVRNGSQTLRRKNFWSLLFGALGTACLGDVRAAGAGPRDEGPDGRLIPRWELRQALSLGESGLGQSVSGTPLGSDEIPGPRLRLDFELGLAPDASGHSPTVVALPVSTPEMLFRSMDPEAPNGPMMPQAGVALGYSGVAPITGVIATDRLGNQPEEPTPVPYDPNPGGTATRTSPARDNRQTVIKAGAGVTELPDLSAETWQLAPIRWAGNTTTSGNQFQSGDGAKSLTIFNNLNLQANSFIMAPYIAQWSGMLGASSAGTTFTPTTGSSVKSDSSSMSYGGSVNVFPLSRFPFSANISRSTSQSRAAEISSPSTSTAVGLRQQYRTEDGRDNYALNFNRNDIATGTATTTTTSALSNFGGSYSASREFAIDHFLEGNHNISANFGSSSATANPATQDSKQFNANLNHGWNVHEDLSISNMLTFAKSDVNTFQGNALTKNDSTVFLGTTGVTWRPFEDLPLTLNGGGNFSKTHTLNNNLPSDLNNLSGFVSTLYRFNNNLSASGNASITSVDSSRVRSTSSVQAGSVSYSGDPLTIAGFTYGWGTGGGLSRSSSSLGSNEIGSSVNASHNLARSIIFGEHGAINVSAGQNLSRTTSQQGPTTSLSNTVGAAWRANYGEQLTANLSSNLILTNSSGVGGNNQFKSANLMGGGIYQVSSRASVSLNANLSWSQSVLSNSTSQVLNGIAINTNTPQSTGSFSLGYTHQNPFSIKNLNYNGTVMRFQSFSNQNVAGAGALSSGDQGSTSIQQLVDYRLGRLIFRFSNSWIEQAGRKSASIFGSVTREFDGFFDGRW